MSFVTEASQAFVAPFFAILSSGIVRYFWVYLVGALIVAFWLFRREGGGGPADFARFIAPKAIWSHASARADLLIVPLNAVLMALPNILAAAAPLAVSEPNLSASAGAPLWAVLAFTAALFLVDDFVHYAGHWLFHRVPALWAFHKVHHSAEVLTPLTADRFHPVELLITGPLRAGGLILVTLAFYRAFPGLTVWTLFGANALLFFFNVFAGTLRHSHLWFAFPPALSRWLISPAMHQIHHSSEERHWDRNMGGSLAVWDRLMGTLYVPVEREQFALGVGEDSSRYRKLTHCYLAPFKEAAECVGITDAAARLTGRRREGKETSPGPV